MVLIYAHIARNTSRKLSFGCSYLTPKKKVLKHGVQDLWGKKILYSSIRHTPVSNNGLALLGTEVRLFSELRACNLLIRISKEPAVI